VCALGNPGALASLVSGHSPQLAPATFPGAEGKGFPVVSAGPMTRLECLGDACRTAIDAFPAPKAGVGSC